MAALDLCGAQFADALGNAPAFDVIGIVGDLRAVVVPIGETADRRRQEQRRRHQPADKTLSPLAAAMPVPELIELQPQQFGDDLDKSLFLAQFRHAHPEHRPLFAAEDGGKALLVRVRGIGRARHHEGNDPVRSAHVDEVLHLPVHPFGFRGRGRTEHDQITGILQLLAEVLQQRAGADVGLVAKDRANLLRQVRRLLPDDAGKAIRLDLLLKPLGPAHVLVLVADERKILVSLVGRGFLAGRPVRNP